MNIKDEAEFKIDSFRVKIKRREQQTGPDRLDVNIYDEPEGTIRDYTQFNFRIEEDDTRRIANYVTTKGQGEPSETALRAVHEYGFDCGNFSLEKPEKPRYEKLDEAAEHLKDVYLEYKDADDRYAALLLNTAWNLALWTHVGDEDRSERGYETMSENIQEIDWGAQVGNPNSGLNQQIHSLAERDYHALWVINQVTKQEANFDILSQYQVIDERGER